MSNTVRDREREKEGKRKKERELNEARSKLDETSMQLQTAELERKDLQVRCIQ